MSIRDEVMNSVAKLAAAGRTNIAATITGQVERELDYAQIARARILAISPLLDDVKVERQMGMAV